jgi:hypothetical protein
MAHVVDLCTRQRVEIEFFTAEGCSPIEIHRCLRSMFGEDAIDCASDAGSVTLRAVTRTLLTGAGVLRERVSCDQLTAAHTKVEKLW